MGAPPLVNPSGITRMGPKPNYPYGVNTFEAHPGTLVGFLPDIKLDLRFKRFKDYWRTFLIIIIRKGL